MAACLQRSLAVLLLALLRPGQSATEARASPDPHAVEPALRGDDQCEGAGGGAACALNALQLRKSRSSRADAAVAADGVGEPTHELAQEGPHNTKRDISAPFMRRVHGWVVRARPRVLEIQNDVLALRANVTEAKLIVMNASGARVNSEMRTLGDGQLAGALEGSAERGNPHTLPRRTRFIMGEIKQLQAELVSGWNELAEVDALRQGIMNTIVSQPDGPPDPAEEDDEVDEDDDDEVGEDDADDGDVGDGSGDDDDGEGDDDKEERTVTDREEDAVADDDGNEKGKMARESPVEQGLHRVHFGPGHDGIPADTSSLTRKNDERNKDGVPLGESHRVMVLRNVKELSKDIKRAERRVIKIGKRIDDTRIEALRWMSLRYKRNAGNASF